MSDIGELVIDGAVSALLDAEERVRSLEADVLARDEIISHLLTAVRSQTLQVERLMWRLKQSQERRRG